MLLTYLLSIMAAVVLGCAMSGLVLILVSKHSSLTLGQRRVLSTLSTGIQTTMVIMSLVMCVGLLL